MGLGDHYRFGKREMFLFRWKLYGSHSLFEGGKETDNKLS